MRMGTQMSTEISRMLKAAAEPTRIRILNLLQDNGVCVCDLQSILQLPQSTVSRHLAALRNSGLVVAERRGPRVCYSMVAASGAQEKAFRRFLKAACPHETQLRRDLQRLKANPALPSDQENGGEET
jgi:ArsR family transcriptional regulator